MQLKANLLIGLIVALILAFGIVGVSLAAPAASVSLGGAGDVFIGTSPVTMSVTFDNTAPTGAANIGYGPFIDVYFPVNGADGTAGTSLPLDGLDYIAGSATYLGEPVVETVLTFPAGPLGGICSPTQSLVDHPYAVDTAHDPIQVCGTPGDKLVVFQLPFGSFTPDQPAATIEFNASLSTFADYNVPLNVSARGGYQYGTDPLDNPCCDPSFFTDGSPTTITDNPVGAVNPILLILEKTNTPPEAEVATGPNYPHTYTVTVEAAPGQTITNLDIFDYIDDNIVITAITAPGASSVTLGGIAPVFPVFPVVSNGTANRLVVTYASFTGTVSFDVEYYVPLRDAAGANIIPPTNGVSSITNNTANTLGDWDPLDPRDTAGTNNAEAGDAACPACPPLVTHENEPMPVQKSLENLTDGTALEPAGSPSPGDVIEYTLSIQISDFFALDNADLFDVISDGQRLTGNPVISFTQHGNTVGGAVTNFQLREYFTGGTPGVGGLPDGDVTAIAGDTVLAIDLSTELALYGFNEILGGCVPVGGTGAGDPNCDPLTGGFNGGATNITITYQTTIQDAFTDEFPSGDASVDHGDTLDNVVTLEIDTVLNTTNLASTGVGSAVVDDTSAGLTIAQGLTEKTIFAITEVNTGTVMMPPPSVPEISPADTITFRLRYEMPSTDFEDFSLSDFLPLPVLDANEVTVFNDVISDGSNVVGLGIPAAGQAMWGPTGVTDGNVNFRTRLTALGLNLQSGSPVPGITTPGSSIPGLCGGTAIDPNENFLNFCFGDFDDPTNVDSFIDILFTVTVSSDPFADGLFLTNFVRGGTGSTNAADANSDEIVRFELREPILLIRKGISDSSNPNETFETEAGATEVPNPNLVPAGSSTTPPFSGTLESSAGGGNGEADNGTDANIGGVDAGDTVRFVITIQNTGGSAAFDIELFDTLPTGLTCNAGTVNLNVTMGDGTPVTYNNLGTANPCDFFSNFDGNALDGIELIDPADGLCQEATVDPARAVIVITYDLTIDNTVSAGDFLINTTTITNFAGTEGGPSHLPDPAEYPTDEAQVEIAGSIQKDLISTSEASSSDTQVGIVGDERPVLVGEVVTYRVYTRIPEGTTNNLQFRDNTPAGLQYVAGSARFAFISNTVGNITSSDVAINGASPGLSGNLPTTPTAFVPVSAVSGGTSSGDDLLISFGNVTNTESDDGAEYVVLEFEMVVNNIAANQAGTFLLNTATMRKNGADLVTSDEDTLDIDNDPVALVVIEPAINITKTATPAASRDAGDTITYTITIENTGNARAFELNLTDTLPLTLDLVSVSTPATPAYYSEASRTVTTGAGGSFAIVVNELRPADTITYTVTATINYTALAAEPIDNTGLVTWTSLPGTQGTGNETPGTSGATNGERNSTGGDNDYTDNDLETITVSTHNATKSITASSETTTSDAGLPNSGTSDVPVTIGEVFRYQLVVDVPEGTSTDLLVLDQLATGIALIEDASIEITTLNFGGGNFDSIDFGAGLEAANGATIDLHNGTIYTFTAPFNLVDYNTGTNLLTFNLGDIVNNDSDANVEQIIITFNVVVLNNATNDLGDILANDFDVFSDDVVGTSELRDSSNVVNVVIQEPQLTIAKSVNPLTGDAGDSFTYTITVTNANGANNSTAFEVQVTDDLGALTDLDLTAVSAAGATDNSNLVTDFVDVTIPSLAPGASFNITLTVVLRSSATPNEVITNTSEAIWTSLPATGTVGNPTGSNTPGGSGADNGERDHSTAPAAPDDYRTTDTADITVDQVVPVKSIIATSETTTDDASLPNNGASDVPVTIGEIVTFQLVVDIPEGTSDDVVMSDILVPGLDYIDGSARVFTNSAAAMNFDDIAGVPNTAPGAVITTGAFPAVAGTVAFDTGTREVQINLGDITNNDSDADAEQVIVTFQVVILNDTVNNLGTIWTNEFDVSVAGNAPVTSNSVSGIIEEPVLTIDKSINTTLSIPSGVTTFDGGDTVVYDIVVTGGAAANQSTAFDLNVIDGIDSNLTLVSVSFIGTPAYATTTDNSTGVAVDVLISELRPGDFITVRVTTTVNSTVTVAQVIANTADVTWTSLPGNQGTGNATPGNSGDSNGERNGDTTSENDHVATDTINFTVTGTVDTIKSIDGTSESHTDDATADTNADPRPVAVGEVITYRLVVEVPEGTSPDVQITDTLAPNIEFIAGTARVSFSANNAFTGTGTYGINEINPTTTVPAGLISFGVTGPRELRFDLGQVINNDNDDAATTELLIVEFQVVVVNTSDNTIGAIWANDFEVDLNNDGIDEDVSNEVYNIVQEPVVTATKAIIGAAPVDALEDVTYDIVVTAGNGTNQETAYNLNLTDVLHPDLQLVSVAIQVNPGYVTIDADNSTYAAGGTVNIDLNRLEPADSVTIRVVATVLTTVSPGETIDNDAIITWTSLPGNQGTGNATPGNSGDSNGERNGTTAGENDHVTPTNTVNFTILSPEPVKSIDGTSELGTSDAEDGSAGNERPVAIGEEITYRLAVVLPESTTISFRMDDVLANGLEYVAGSARVSYLADTLPSFNGDFVGIQNETEPSFAFPVARVNFDAGTRTLSFDFGSIINNDGDANREYIIVEFTVVVIDDVVNNTGQIWANDFDVIVDEGLPTETITTSNEVGVIVVEPAVNITKTFSPDEQVRGGTVTMTLVVDNLAANGATGPAYDLQVTDILDDWLNVTAVNVIFSGTATSSNATDNSVITAGFATGVTDNIDVLIDTLPVDGVATITVTMQVDPNADPLLLSRTITNTATVVNDTLSTDITPDDEDREYTDSASDDLNVVKPTLLVTKTDSLDPVAAGALMSYTVSIQNTGTPNFAATNVQFRDQIPTGFIVTLVTPSQGTCSPIVGGILSCSLGTIASGASANVVITGRYPATTASGTITNNIAYVTSTEGNHGNDGNDTPTDNDDERAEEPTTILRQVDVAITKVVDDASPNEGDLITFTLNIRNNGPSQATNVIVTDSIPTGLTFVQFVPTSLPCVYAAPTLTCTFPTLNVGAIQTIGIEATVDAGTAGGAVITNIASVTTTEPETNPANNTDDATVTVDSMDLQVVKVVDDATPNEGDTIVYTITITNLGPAPATGISITDDLNAVNGISYVSDNSASTATTYSSATGLWTLTGVTLDAGESLSLQITATVDAGASALPQPLVNNASITTSDQPDTNPANNNDNANVSVGGLDLSLIKGVNNPTPNEGATIVYSLIVQNLGAANATNIVVLDQLDTIPVTYVSHTASVGGTTYDPVTGQWTIPGLNAGRTIRLDITVTVDAGTAGSTITNVASINSLDQSDANPANNTDDAVITVGSLDLAVTKTVDDSTPAEGGTIVYSVTITNNGPATATGVILSDALPAGLTYVSDNSTTLLDSTGAATFYGAGNWLVGTLNSGASLTLQITATVDAGTSGTTIDNIASLSAVNQPDTNPTNNIDNAVIAVSGLDLQVTKVVDNATANEGDTLVYSITLENFGAANATNITVTDDLNILPLSYVSDNAATVLDSAGAATSYIPATGAWTIGQLDAGASLTLQITVTVNAGTSGTSITNTASLTAVDQADSNPANNDDDAVVSVGGVDIEVLKLVDNPTPAQGDDVTYTITVTNNGPGDATGVVISEDLPLDGVNLTYVSHSASQGTFTVGAPGTWNIGNLNAGQSVTLQLTVTVEIDNGQILNVASLSSIDQPDTDPTNNSDDATITLNGIDLAVVKTVDNPIPATGDTVTYSIVATNNGPTTATGVNVLDILPAGVAYISDNSALLLDDTGATTTFTSATGNWAIGQLNAGSSLTLNIQVTVLVNGGTVINTAEITGNEPESDNSNNIDDATISVDSADLSLTKTISTTTPQVGDFITYTVTVSNAGPNIAYNVEVTDTLPTTVTYTGTHTPSQGTFNGTVWTVGTIPVNGAASLQITVQVISNVGTFVNVAEVTASDQTDPDSTPNNGDPGEDDYDESSFVFDPPFGRKVFDASGLPQLEWTVIWVNPNTNPLSVNVSDPIPAGTSFVTGSLTCTSPGTLVVNSCAFDPVSNEIIFTGTIFPDPGATPATINSATNRLIINYRVNVNSSVTVVRNEALLDSVNGDNVAVSATWRRDDAAAPSGTGSAITLTKYVEPAIAFPGQSLTWILEVSNPSGTAATGIVVTDNIPVGLNIQSTQADIGTASVSGQNVTWNLGTVAAGQTVRLRIVTQVDPSLSAPVTNTAILTGDNVASMEASATAAFVAGLPNTGETTWWTWLLWTALLIVPLSLAGLWWLRRRMA